MRKPRLRRLEWVYTDCPVYFVTAATHKRRHLLNQELVHKSFVTFCGKAPDRGVLVGRYVLMPDHLHLFVATAPNGLSLSRWMQVLKVTLAGTLSAQGHRSPFWQKGFFDHVLRSGESYAQKWEYVRLNPVRAGLTGRAEDWPFQGELFPLEF